MKKALILKLGYSETLNSEISKTCSLGDVLRTTVILNYFKDYKVTWVVDERALPLLENNPHIDRILTWNLETVLQLQQEYYHTVVNLEKIPGVCALSDNIHSMRTYGFSFDSIDGVATAQVETERVLAIANDHEKKRRSKTYWQQHLAKVIGQEWVPMDKYILNPRKSKEVHDVGLNIRVGTKWPTKAWPTKCWHELGTLLSRAGLNVSWQEGYQDLNEYMDWVASNKVVVTCDSLGLHLALALGKSVIGLFGPSSSREVYMYDQGIAMTPKSNFGCIPCFNSTCIRDEECMHKIFPEDVFDEIKNQMDKGKVNKV